MSKLADMAWGEENFIEDKGNNDSNLFVKIRERAFYKELVKVIEASDVILEVLDARDPLGTHCVDMEKMVMRTGPEKHLLLLLNKIDLVPKEAAEKWLKYLTEELPIVAFKCSTQEQKSNLGWKSSSKAGKTTNLLQTSDCLGAENLIKLLKNYSRTHELLLGSILYWFSPIYLAAQFWNKHWSFNCYLFGAQAVSYHASILAACTNSSTLLVLLHLH